jgi:hypothetical protein
MNTHQSTMETVVSNYAPVLCTGVGKIKVHPNPTLWLYCKWHSSPPIKAQDKEITWNNMLHLSYTLVTMHFVLSNKLNDEGVERIQHHFHSGTGTVPSNVRQHVLSAGVTMTRYWSWPPNVAVKFSLHYPLQWYGIVLRQRNDISFAGFEVFTAV